MLLCLPSLQAQLRQNVALLEIVGPYSVSRTHMKIKINRLMRQVAHLWIMETAHESICMKSAQSNTFLQLRVATMTNSILLR